MRHCWIFCNSGYTYVYVLLPSWQISILWVGILLSLSRSTALDRVSRRVRYMLLIRVTNVFGLGFGHWKFPRNVHEVSIKVIIPKIHQSMISLSFHSIGCFGGRTFCRQTFISWSFRPGTFGPGYFSSPDLFSKYPCLHLKSRKVLRLLKTDYCSSLVRFGLRLGFL